MVVDCRHTGLLSSIGNRTNCCPLFVFFFSNMNDSIFVLKDQTNIVATKLPSVHLPTPIHRFHAEKEHGIGIDRVGNHGCTALAFFDSIVPSCSLFISDNEEASHNTTTALGIFSISTNNSRWYPSLRPSHTRRRESTGVPKNKAVE